jgi:hypothetical protein
MQAISLRTPVRMSDKSNKSQFNPKKLQKALQKLNKEGEKRRKSLDESLQKLISEADQTARKDVETLRDLVQQDATVTVSSLDDYDEFDDVIVFRDPK